MPPRALWLNSTSRATAATLHVLRQYCGTSAERSPALSARARYELGLAPLSLSTIATLSGSHVIAGAAVAVSSLGSALAIAMMVGVAVGRPPWSRGFVQTGSVHRGSGTVLIG